MSALQVCFVVPLFAFAPCERGWYGFARHIKLGGGSVLAYGGAAQRDKMHVELDAQACARIRDWNAVRVWCETYQATITRADLAHDDFAGERVTVAAALQWFHEGKFNVGGRSPERRLIDDLGSGKGKTFYVGQRQSGKLLRVYEKGRQLGDPESPWVRAEVELRNKSRIVPLNVVTKPGQYLAGAYPALRFLSESPEHVRTVQKALSISYRSMVRNLRAQGGKALNVMCEVHAGDACAVLAEVMRDGVPKRLAGYPAEARAWLAEDDVP